jgi:hypothetical protein
MVLIPLICCPSGPAIEALERADTARRALSRETKVRRWIAGVESPRAKGERRARLKLREAMLIDRWVFKGDERRFL